MTITGRPIVKKNNRRNFGYTSLPSKAYLRYEQSALEQLLPHKKKRYDQPIKVSIVFYVQGKYHVDVDNLSSSILDILQKSTIIKDDDLVMELNAKKIPGCGGWSTKIEIEEL